MIRHRRCFKVWTMKKLNRLYKRKWIKRRAHIYTLLAVGFMFPCGAMGVLFAVSLFEMHQRGGLAFSRLPSRMYWGMGLLLIQLTLIGLAVYHWITEPKSKVAFLKSDSA